MHNLLITGGAGFIGSNFVHYWKDKYPADYLVVLDSLTYAGNIANIKESIDAQCKFVHASVTDKPLLDKVLSENNIDTVVHFAAESHVDRSITEPDAFIQTNIIGTHNLLLACKEYWLTEEHKEHRFHNVSTDEVYGMLGQDDSPFTEKTRYEPSSPYSASKASADHLVRAYAQTYGLQISISNCSNNYGPYHFPEKLIPLTIVNLITGKQIPVYGDGMQIRDWLHVNDHCEAIDAILTKGKFNETYNIGANCELTNKEVVNTVCRLFDAEFSASSELARTFPNAKIASGEASVESIISVADRPGHDFRYAIDAEKISSELGFKSSVLFEDGIRDTIRWYLNNENWWRDIMDGSYRDYIKTFYGTL